MILASEAFARGEALDHLQAVMETKLGKAILDKMAKVAKMPSLEMARLVVVDFEIRKFYLKAVITVTDNLKKESVG